MTLPTLAAELGALADAAVQGEWVFKEGIKTLWVDAPEANQSVCDVDIIRPAPGNRAQSVANGRFIAACSPTTIKALLARLGELEAEREWRPIDDHARRGQRLVLCWDDSETLAAHWETGRYKNGVGKDSGWCNTYGHPFASAPTHYMEPLPPSPKPAQEV